MVSTKMGGPGGGWICSTSHSLLISELKDLKNSHGLPKASGLVFSAVCNFDWIIGEILSCLSEEVSLCIWKTSSSVSQNPASESPGQFIKMQIAGPSPWVSDSVNLCGAQELAFSAGEADAVLGPDLENHY